MTDHFEPDLEPLPIFNAEAAVGYFGFLPQTPTEKQAIRFLYQCMDYNFGGKEDTSEEHAEMIGNVTIEKIKFRYELYKLHGDLFFPSDYKANHEALSIAVICDEYTGNINEKLEEPEPPEDWVNDNDNFPVRDDGFSDPNEVGNAYAIWDKATDLEGAGLIDDAPLLAPEIVFLAHINVMEAIREMEKTFDDYTQEQLTDILAHDFRAARDFILPSTSIGLALQDYMDQMESRILASIVIRPEEMPNRGLKVVTTEGPTLQ